MKRFFELDFLRGIAIILMVLFHFFWDLNYFGFISFNLYTGIFGLIQKSSAFLFLFLVGITRTISYNNRKNYAFHFLKNGLFIFSGGLLITFFSLVFFPNQFIYFGVLHLIGLSVIILIPLIKRKNLSLILGLILIIMPFIINLQEINLPFLLFAGLAKPIPTLDFYPLIPWFGIILLGVFFGHTFYPKGIQLIKLRKHENKAVNLTCFLGKHSLIIYFIHQPIIFPLIMLTAKVFV